MVAADAEKSTLDANELQINGTLMRATADETGGMFDALISKVGKETEASIAWSIRLTIALSAIALAVGIAIAWATARSIVRPVVGMTDTMTHLADGNKAVDVPALDRKDEVGQMAKAVQVFKDNMIKADDLAEAQKREQAAKEERAKRVNALTADFDTKIGNVVQAVSAQAVQMENSAQTLTATAEESTKQASTVAAGLGTGFGQCADGGLGDGRTQFLHRRDQPSGGAVQPHRRRRGGRGRQGQ